MLLPPLLQRSFVSQTMSHYHTWNRWERWRSTYTNNLPELGPIATYNVQNLPALAFIRSGSSVPGWKEKIASGAPATSNFTGQKYQLKDKVPGSAQWSYWSPPWNRWLVYTARGDLQLAPNFGLTHLDPTNADNNARADLYKKIKSAQTKMSGQVFIGELREALRMIKSPAKALRDGLGAYLSTLEKRGRGRHTKQSKRRALSDTWLEYSFGWAPLIGDIEGAFKAYRRIMDQVSTARVRGLGFSEQFGTSTVGQVAHNSLLFTERYRMFKRVEVKYTAGLKDTKLGESLAADTISSFGLGAREFIPTAWELLPWSFLADYFTNIGDVLEAASTDTSNVTWVCKTVRRSIIQEVVLDFDADKTMKQVTTPIRYCEGMGGGYRLTIDHVSRTASALQLPSFTVRYPGLGSFKWVNIAALASSAKKMTPYY